MNKYIISKGNTLVKLDTDKLDVDHIGHSYDIDRNSGEKICDSCEPVCECSNNY